MKTILAVLPSLIMSVSSTSWAYTSPSSQEAKVSFNHWVELSREDATSEVTTRAVIELQLEHLAGSLAMSPKVGASKFDHVVSNVVIAQPATGSFIARYSYYGSVLLQKGFKSQMPLPLPNNPKTIWQTSVENSRKFKLNPCTDETYQTQPDFAYFWSPERPGCKKVLKEGRDYTYATANLNGIANTKRTYPEFARLVESDGTISITYLIGKDHPSRVRSPFNRKGHDDLNAKNFRAFAVELEKMGFESREWTNKEVRQVVKEPLNPLPYVLEFTQNYKGIRAKKMVVRLVYSTSQPDYAVTGFLYFLEYALKNSSIMVFDGHSGIGADNGLPGVKNAAEEKFDLATNKDRYQIFFFNSCSSYSYYNAGVFGRKGGSKNLDLVSTGLETAFDGSVDVNTAFVNTFHQWALQGRVTSYQNLMKQLDTDNLVGVNGDEDNP